MSAPKPRSVPRATANQLEAMLDAYRDGTTTRELARTHGMHLQTDRKHLRNAGVTLRLEHKSKVTPQLEYDVVARYSTGLSAAAVGKQIGLSATGVTNVLNRQGIRLRQRNHQSETRKRFP